MSASPESIPPHLTPAGRLVSLIPALVALLAALCVIETATIVVSAWPFATGDVYWRFQAATQVLMLGPRIALLLTVISIASVQAGRHQSVRAAAAAYFLLAAIVTIVLPFFALDFMTERALVKQDLLSGFTHNGERLVAMTLLLVPFLIWAGVRAWAAGTPDPGPAPGVGYGLVVGQID